ncbi:MAG: ImmA/IrrE family metallo-endopeptidase [Deferribacteraceae bacterium]|jgi:Zn-dependent peptidase ImmA (M78 family)/DNA-binding XRE family transcriptional regulator|nr:ImmA/IrrE family metallo-endopeptidase [Deferribacteraceae bacterium]
MKNRSVIGENVLKLRHERALTQSELAELALLSLPTIKNIEGGKDIARRSTLEAIARALQVKADVLLAPSRRLSGVRFRSVKGLRLKWQILSELSRKLDKYCELERLNGLSPIPRWKSLKENDPVKLAAKVRKKIKLPPYVGVADILSVASYLGIKVLKVNADTDKFFGLSVGEADGGPAVIANENWRYSYERIVFTIARETAHLLLHSLKDKDRIELETEEANTFASHFLMPEEGFRFHWNLSKHLNWGDRVVKLKNIFSIPPPEILSRLQAHEKYEVLEEKFLKHFNGHLEPYPLKIHINIEQHFAYLVLLSVRRDFITSQKAAEILDISENSVKGLAEELDYLAEI